MLARFAHTNLVAKDWRKLAQFYMDVFDCIPAGPERDISGDWLDTSTGLQNARIRGQHLRVPGHGPSGPTLEIFSYDDAVDQSHPVANRTGFGHIAFAVEDVQEALEQVLTHGGTKLGEPVTHDIPDAGPITFVYARDPEGNIIELQRWH